MFDDFLHQLVSGSLPSCHLNKAFLYLKSVFQNVIVANCTNNCNLHWNLEIIVHCTGVNVLSQHDTYKNKIGSIFYGPQYIILPSDSCAVHGIFATVIEINVRHTATLVVQLNIKTGV